MNKLDSVKLYCVDGWFPTANRPAHTFNLFITENVDVNQIYSLESFLCNVPDIVNLHPLQRRLPLTQEFDIDIDLLFIDANHSYAGTIHNIRQFCSRVKPGGTILFDDYTDSWPGVVKAVDEYAITINKEVTVLRGSVAMFVLD